jgi:four helix bundle protein
VQNDGDEETASRARKGDDIARRLLRLAVRIGKGVDALPDTRLGRHIAGQLVRCGTSPPPNYDEARAAGSHDDFVHKLGIVFKELRESRVWPSLIMEAELLRPEQLTDLIDECDPLCNIIGKSRATAQANSRTKRHR